MGRRDQELKLPPEELAAGFLKDRATVDALLEPPRARRMARLNRLAQNLVLAGSICVACYFGSIILWHYAAPPPDDFGSCFAGEPACSKTTFPRLIHSSSSGGGGGRSRSWIGV